jgi:predicted TIM-barrel fold metal-dependent hydrolase
MKQMTIDIFCHHIPRSISRLIRKAGYYEIDSPDGTGLYLYPANNTDPEVRLEVMDKYGIELQALSQTVPVLLGSTPSEEAEICRLSNDGNYALCKAYPSRFVNISIVSLLDVKSAMKELDRSINELDCRGVTVASNQRGKGLDAPEYYPFYEKLVQHNLPLWIQPTTWGSYPLVDVESGLKAMNVIGWPFDTTQAVWRLLMGGVLDRYPSLKIVTHHCGAMIPYFAKRLEENLIQWLPRPIAEYWDNIYGDTALSGSTAGCQCGYTFFGAERMMFGSDYPFGGEANVKATLASVKAMDIPANDMNKILSGNAKALLNIP